MPPHYVVERVVHSQKDGETFTDTVYHRLRPFAMVNQLGDTITLSAIDGTLTLVNFFSAQDTTVSAKVARALKKLASSFAQSDTGFHVLSITTDPVADSLPVLLDYAFRLQVKHNVWWFLRDSLSVVKDIAATDFKVSLKPHGPQNLLSSPTLVLLDRFQHVRGYYNALDSTAVRRCARDLSLLMIEKEKLNGVER